MLPTKEAFAPTRTMQQRILLAAVFLMAAQEEPSSVYKVGLGSVRFLLADGRTHATLDFQRYVLA